MARMTGNRYFAEAMRGYGVTHLFYVNSVVGAAMQEMDKVGVTRVVTHGEKAAAYMADGYARASHRPGVCLSQDIGTTNLLAGVRDAHMASVPLIAVTGGQNDMPRYRHAYQNAEDFKAWDAVTKANYSVDTAERFPDLLRQAFRDATSGTPGPVHLELRGNTGQMLNHIDPQELGRNYPNTVSMCGDAKVTLAKLIEAAGSETPRRAEWLEQVRSYVADYWAESEPLRNSDAVPLRPERICKELEQWLPAGATLVVDTFHAAIWTAQMTRLLKPGQRYIRCAGSLGWAFPATLGVKAALGDQPVVGFCGDAGFYYHMAELETAARCGLNLVMVVNNNHSGGVSESAGFVRAVNFAKVAEAMGCCGIRVERGADIQPALDQALAAGTPAIVEVLSDAKIRAKRGWVPAAAVSGAGTP